MKTFDVAIVGAGIFGLTAAYRLSRRGYSVIVFEKDREPGGLCSVFPYKNTYVEKYHHFVSGKDDTLMELCRELGLHGAIGWNPGKTGNWINGHIYPFYRALDVLRFRELPLVDRLRFGLAFAALQKIPSWKKLEGVSAKEFISRWAGKRTYEMIWAPLMESKFAGHVDDIPTSWLWSRSRRRLGSRLIEDKGHLFGYFRDSIKVLTDRLIEENTKRGVTLKLGEPVRRVLMKDGKVAGIKTDRGEYPCRSVLYTAALPYLLQSVNGLKEDMVRTMEQIEYQAILNVTLITRNRLSDYFWVNVLSRDIPFPGVIELSNLRDPAELAGGHLIYLPRYIPREDPLYLKSDKELVALFIKGLKRIFPSLKDSDVIEARVFRDDYADPFYTLHYSKKMPPFETGIGGLFLGNTTQIYPDTRSAHNSIMFGSKLSEMISDWLGPPSSPRR